MGVRPGCKVGVWCRNFPRGLALDFVFSVRLRRVLITLGGTALLLFRLSFSPRVNTCENFSGFLNIAGRPEPDSYRPHFHHWRRADGSRRNVSLEGNERAA
jgi:hypothetical protein